MRGVAFPFQVIDGKVDTSDGLESLKERLKRAIHYSTQDLPYSTEVGSGANNAVFAPDISKGVQTFLRSTVEDAVLSIDGVSRVNVQTKSAENGVDITVFYFVDGETEMQEYTFNSNE